MTPELVAAAVSLCILAEGGSKPNRRENALGPLQIRPIYVRDLNEQTGSHWRHRDATDPVKARKIATQYLTHWGNHYERRTGRPATVEVLCRIHNGGPRGWQKRATLAYWHKAQAAQAAEPMLAQL